MYKSALILVVLLSHLSSTTLFASQTYIISYRAQVKNAIIISESFYLTQSMQEVQAIKGKVLYLDAVDKTNLHAIMKNNKDEVLEFLMKYGTHTRSHEKVKDYQTSSLVSITLPPTYITVDFKNDYAIITRLIQDK